MLYKFPDGNVSGPRDFIANNGCSYGVGTFDVANPAGLLALGVKPFTEDALPVDATGWPYLPGEPVDVETATKVRRTWPNSVPDVDGSAAHQLQIITQYIGGVQAALDATAQSWGYDSLVSAASYATSTNAQFRMEATALISWRDAVWLWAQDQEVGIKAGTIPMPISPVAFAASMPASPARPKAS